MGALASNFVNRPPGRGTGYRANPLNNGRNRQGAIPSMVQSHRSNLSSKAALGQQTGGSLSWRRQGNRKSKKKKFRSKPISKKLKKTIKRVAHNVRHCINNIEVTSLQQIGNTVNKVSYELLSALTQNTLLQYCQSEVILTATDGVSTVVTQEPADLAAVVNGFKKFLVHQRQGMIFRNNTNTVAIIYIYRVKCMDDVANDPLVDLDNRITQSKMIKTFTSTETPGAAMAKEDNFQQYWSTPTMKDAQWKLLEKVRVELAPGGEHRMSMIMKIPVNTRLPYSGAYPKGIQHIFTRICGKVTHDDETISEICLSPTLVDIQMDIRIKVWSLGDVQQTGVYSTLANTGFTAADHPVVATDAVMEEVDFKEEA